MALSRDDILLDNIKEALALYQRSLVWATTAALSGGLITLRLRDPNPEPIPILFGTPILTLLRRLRMFRPKRPEGAALFDHD